MSSLRMIRMLGLSGALPPFAMVVFLLEALKCSGMTPRQIDAEAKIVRQINRAQQFKRASVRVYGETFDRQQRAAGLDAEQAAGGGVRERGADGLRGFPDIEPDLGFEHAVHHDRGEVAFLQFESDVRRIKCVLDRDRNVVGKPNALELPDRALPQFYADFGI